jgi:hypothetical protein
MLLVYSQQSFPAPFKHAAASVNEGKNWQLIAQWLPHLLRLNSDGYVIISAQPIEVISKSLL